MNVIQMLWEQERCPDIDGLLYATGKYVPWNAAAEQIDGSKSRYSLREFAPPSEPCNILSEVQEEWNATHDLCNFMSVTPAKEVYSVTGHIICGECGGSEGFIALEDLEKALIWILFLRRSNPFLKLSTDGDFVIATTNHGYSLRFMPVSSPKFTVIDPE